MRILPPSIIVRSPRWLALAAFGWLGLLSPAHALTITNVVSANVTAEGFTVVFQTSAIARPAISIYADAAGVTNLSSALGVETYPLQSGDPTVTEAHLQRQNLLSLRGRIRARGLSMIRVRDCQPGTTYYYRVQASDGVTNTAWPASGPLPSVTTAVANSFLLDSRQLVIDLGGPDSSGQVVLLSSAGSAYALAGVAGDGAGPNEVYFNLSHLLALAGGTNYTPVGAQQFLAQIPGRTGAGATNTYSVSFAAQFVVGTSQTGSFTGLDAVQIALGRTVLRAAATGGVPIDIVSTAALTNVSLALDIPTNTLVNLALQPLASAVGQATVQMASATRAVLTLGAAPGQVLQGTQRLANLTFTAAPNQPSAFLPLRPQQLTAARGDASLVTNLFVEAGRVVVVAAEPLLETVPGPGVSPELLLYGKPWSAYQLQRTPTLTPPVSWTNGPRIALSNIVQTLDGNLLSGGTGFLRAYELPGDPPVLEGALGTAGTRQLTLFGAPGGSYRLEYATNLSGAVQWIPQLNYTLTNAFRSAPGLPGTAVFYRIVKP